MNQNLILEKNIEKKLKINDEKEKKNIDSFKN
jgi:hypothetical protein